MSAKARPSRRPLRSSNGASHAKKRGVAGKGLSLEMKRMQDEEISSDDDDDDDGNYGGKRQGHAGYDDEDVDLETPDEKRRRLAKMYLSQVTSAAEKDQDSSEDDDDDDDGEYVSHALKIDRLKREGRHYKSLHHGFSTLNLKDTTYRHCTGHRGPITCLALSEDGGRQVYTGGKDNAVICWDTETGKREELAKAWNPSLETQAHEGEILAIAVSSDGRYCASGGRDKLIRMYDRRSKVAEVKTLQGHNGAISALAFQVGGMALFSGSHDRTIKHWDVGTLSYVETLFGHQVRGSSSWRSCARRRVRTFACVCGCMQSFFFLSTLQSYSLKTHVQDAVLALDCGRDLKPVSAGSDRSARVWKVETGSHLVFRKHSSPIDCAQIVGEKTFISGGQDGRINLWSENSRGPLASVSNAHGLEEQSGCPRWITSLAAVKASDCFASGSHDGLVRIWSCSSDEASIKAALDIPLKGFVNGIAANSELLVAGCGREHRLGRWWSLRHSEAKDRLTIIRYGKHLEN